MDSEKAQLLEDKIASLSTEEKIQTDLVSDPTVPPHFYKRAKMETFEGKSVPIFTRMRTKTVVGPASQLDSTVDTICNGTEEDWVLSKLLPVPKRPGKTTGTDHVIAVFLCVDKIILPMISKDAVAPADASIDDDVQKRAEAWEAQNTK